jgi:4-aminobutyrate aminotransferase-like enzyme
MYRVYEQTKTLNATQGRGVRLRDESGTWYLDTRNNVAHVGHQNPAVVTAIQNQAATLNTNTRYLHANMTALAQRLAERLPDPLEVVFFCNSGSEANDLALRLARVYAKGSCNTIVVEGAYHGHTLATLEVSPYKYASGETELVLPSDAPHGQPVPGHHIYPVPAPDVYRGVHRDIATAGADYAAYVQQACEYYRAKGERVRAFIVEGGMSVAGVLLSPPGYLKACQRAVHAAGGLYIADEVQTGLGRLGEDSFFAFQVHDKDLVPDVVTLGKPLGNGMPLAAVVTTRTVAAALEATGVEYFNTFAGNPVCAAAGLAVLDQVTDLRLDVHASQIGTYLRQGLERFQLDLIGDVRGCGLFLGIEFVTDPIDQTPAVLETSFLCSILKSKYNILTSIDGPHHNVLVVKPPMVFNQTDADIFLKALYQTITVDLPAAGDLRISQVGHTPT